MTALQFKLSKDPLNPSEWEEPVYANHRITLAVGGEGSGKSTVAGFFGTVHSIYDKLFGDAELYWVVGFDFEDARRDLQCILDFQRKLDNVIEPSVKGGSTFPVQKEKQWVLRTKTGQQFVTISSYDYDKLGREEPDGIIGAEVGRWYPETYQRCVGRIARKYPRAWLWISGSPKTSQGWLPDLASMGAGPNPEDVRAYHIPTWANRFIYPGGRDDPAIKSLEAGSDPRYFAERYGGLFVPSGAVVFSTFRYNLHVDYGLDYDPSIPVYLAIDPGTKVYSVLFVQLPTNGEVHVVDEVYVSRWTHEQVINEVRSRPGYMLVSNSSSGAIDIASTQVHMGMNMPMTEWYKDTGKVLYANKWPLDDSIERVRAALAYNPNTGRPRLRVHPRCKGIISEMGGGPSPVEGGGPWMYFETKNGLGPPKKENNHSCMALSYLLAGPFGFSTVERSKSVNVASYLAKPKEPTMNDLEKMLGIGAK